jgi:iron complex transport system ATP-binding protein
VVKLLEAVGLEHAYEDRGGGAAIPTLHGIDLSLGPGELLCVLGPNGAGKSTLLRALTGLIEPTRGQVLMHGKVAHRLDSRERARLVALVPQLLHALPEVTVETFVGYGRYAHQGYFTRPSQGDRAAVLRALAAADACELSARPLAELSGGQLQRVLFARALAQEAEVLLVDEPTSSLDPQHQVAAFELVARLTCEGHAAVVVTHELNLASQFATRLLLLDAGRPVAEGSVQEVLRREVLEPVYGRHLAYGELPAPRGDGKRPFVVPWLSVAGESDASTRG